MKALILNSGTGSRMGDITQSQPKCMTMLQNGQTILSRQLQQLSAAGVTEIVITTGKYDWMIRSYCASLKLPVAISYVKNEVYDQTNYIYSMYLAKELLQSDLLLLHGDLVFDTSVLLDALDSSDSCMVVSSTLPLPEKDFKAVVSDGKITAVGIDFFESTMAAQPLYKLNNSDRTIWFNEISAFCNANNLKCYAENALNEVLNEFALMPLDIKNKFCGEIDTVEDLAAVNKKIEEIEQKSVYMCFSADILHSGHLAIIKKAKELGSLTVAVLTDEAVTAYKRFPLLPFSERKDLLENICGVDRVVVQDTLSYKENLLKYKPDFVVHGDDWKNSFQQPIREEVISTLAEYGGELVEFPYSCDEKHTELEKRTRAEMAMPDIRRGRLKKCINLQGLVTAIEAHSGLTGLIAENTIAYKDGAAHQFDAMWVSSLCDSTAKGKPDIELVDMTSRFRTIDDIMEVTTKPIIFDGDTGGLTEHFVYTVRTLERMGVSMIIIEDKTGLKKNSLFGAEVEQTQDSIENFCHKIKEGKKAQKTKDFMICARIESLILEQGMADALERAFAFAEVGADAIMIHSRKKEPSEIFEFVEEFRVHDKTTPIVVVPTAFNSVTEEEFKERGVNVIIYANQLTRTAFPAMQNAAKTILENHRAKECDDICMSFNEIITLIPDEI